MLVVTMREDDESVLSPKTVRNHVANPLNKVEAPDRSAAIIKARDEGLGID